MRRLGYALLALVCVPAILLAQGPLTPTVPTVYSVYQGNTPIRPRHIAVDTAVVNTILVNETADKRICILAVHLTMTGTAVTIRFEDTGGGEPLSGQFTPSQGQSVVLPFNPACWYITSEELAFNMELGGTQSVDGSLVYAYIDP